MIFSNNEVTGIISGITIHSKLCQSQELFKKTQQKQNLTLFIIFNSEL